MKTTSTARKRSRAGSAAKRSALAAHRTKASRTEVEQEVRRLRSARAQLERRLTAAVQEIGTLRQFELRATALEAELRKREQELARVRRESAERIRALEATLSAASPVPPPA